MGRDFQGATISQYDLSANEIARAKVFQGVDTIKRMIQCICTYCRFETNRTCENRQCRWEVQPVRRSVVSPEETAIKE